MGVRPFVIWLDAVIRRRRGVFTFSTDEDCLLRLELGKASHALRLNGCTVEKGDPVLFLHLWNEHLPPLPVSGPTLAWAKRVERLFVGSLRRAAEEIRRDPRLATVRAVGGVTAVFAPDPGSSGARFLRRLGFTVLPYHGRLGWFGEFWENLYSLWLIRAYNPASLRGRRVSGLHRTEIWMPVEDFLANFVGERRVRPPCPVGVGEGDEEETDRQRG